MHCKLEKPLSSTQQSSCTLILCEGPRKDSLDISASCNHVQTVKCDEEVVTVMPDYFTVNFLWSRWTITPITIVLLIKVRNKILYNNHVVIIIIFTECTLCQTLAKCFKEIMLFYWFMKQTGFSRRGAESSFVLSHPVDCCFSPTLALDEIWSTSQSLSDTRQPKSRLFIKSINWNLSQNVSCHPAGAQEPIEESVVGAFSLRRLFFLFTSNSCLWSIGWEQWGETARFCLVSGSCELWMLHTWCWFFCSRGARVDFEKPAIFRDGPPVVASVVPSDAASSLPHADSPQDLWLGRVVPLLTSLLPFS